MKVFIYYTPCQVFSFLIGIYGMKRLKMHPEKYDDTLSRQFHRVFLWTAIFSVLIIIEDVIVIFNFDNYGVTGIHITNRSFTENLMSIYFVYTALRILVPYLRSLMISEEAAASAGNTGVQAISAEHETTLDSGSPQYAEIPCLCHSNYISLFSTLCIDNTADPKDTAVNTSEVSFQNGPYAGLPEFWSDNPPESRQHNNPHCLSVYPAFLLVNIPKNLLR